jgi:plasmid maintenance system antidote protein VapI
MDLHIDVELREGLLLVTASGDVTLEAAVRLLKQVFDTADEKKVTKILVTTLAVNGELSTFDRYQLGSQFAEYIREHQMNPRVAFVGKRPTTDGFGARVAQNRGMVAEVFYNLQDAINWLARWPS